jgi:hypothetical protein
MLFQPNTLLAHPIGNNTINRYARLDVGDSSINIRYVVDFGELTAQVERKKMDVDGDNAINSFEEIAYLQDLTPVLIRNLYLLLNGKRQNLGLRLSPSVYFNPGEDGLVTMRVVYDFVVGFTDAHFANNAVVYVEFEDINYWQVAGLTELVGRSSGNIVILKSNVPNIDLTKELKFYSSDVSFAPPVAHFAGMYLAKKPVPRALTDERETLLIKANRALFLSPFVLASLKALPIAGIVGAIYIVYYYIVHWS